MIALFSFAHTNSKETSAHRKGKNMKLLELIFFQSKILIIIKQSYYNKIIRLYPLFMFMYDLNMLIRNLFITFLNEHSYPNITWSMKYKASLHSTFQIRHYDDDIMCVEITILNKINGVCMLWINVYLIASICCDLRYTTHCFTQLIKQLIVVCYI